MDLLLILLLCLASLQRVQGQIQNLYEVSGTVKVNPQRVTMAGFSSGAIFAHQFHVIHSSLLRGVGLLCGGLYGTFNGSIWEAPARTRPATVDVPAVQDEVRARANKGEIESLDHLENSKVFIFHGKLDRVIRAGNSDKVNQFYQGFLSDAANIRMVRGPYMVHIWPTAIDTNSDRCDAVGLPYFDNYIRNCQYDVIGDMLQHFYGPPSVELAAEEPSSILRRFNQSMFTDATSLMDTVGTIYIPSRCQEEGAECGLHLVLHGCFQGRQAIGDVLATKTEHFYWADVYNVILVFPQIVSSRRNSGSCWDVEGYTGPDYDIKHGKQVEAVKGIIEAFL
ncbi:unnamed protein product [Cyprideis torosa]|uniref:Uncharacterized protein n=1 Tax=Cyprideis torosa TaxID=163714 RepID=A0A7R8WDX2_9CRUS|nr:unnamed protein product [Cyprideis torosa]CAG0892263.1 unnamed protein product [Cyprideis torosa]